MKTYISCINGKWYAFAGDLSTDQVYSIGRDSQGAQESGGRCWFAKWSDKGIQYVASSSPTKAAAAARARRHGEYGGEV